ncbi:MAG: hypothetical protein RRZ84_03625 [Romboutsia sp.]
MKQKIILAITLISIFITGCSFKSETTFSQDGKVALENHQYEDAIKLLSSALEENSEDEHSRAMYMQARRMINVAKYEEIKNYNKAIKELELINDIKGGSSNIKSGASAKKKELENLYKEQQQAEQKRKDSAKSTVSKDKYRLEQEALALEQKRLEEEKRNQEEKEEEENQEEVSDKEEITQPPAVVPET